MSSGSQYTKELQYYSYVGVPYQLLLLFNSPENNLYSNLCRSTPDSLLEALDTLSKIHTYLDDNTTKELSINLFNERKYRDGFRFKNTETPIEEEDREKESMIQTVTEKNDTIQLVLGDAQYD